MIRLVWVAVSVFIHGFNGLLGPVANGSTGHSLDGVHKFFDSTQATFDNDM
jgi:hypothetical protein